MNIKSLVRQGAVFLLLLSLLDQAGATGYFGPAFYLDEGGRQVAASPEFYWELEVKRLAHDFHPEEKLGQRNLAPFQTPADREAWENRITAEADANDFADALRSGRIKPPDPAAATQAETAARAVLAQTNAESALALPPEFPSEFADYHRGAFAYRRGPEHWEEARQAWENLLKRPEAERHYRTVWAAFMLGKITLKQNDPAAVDWFERARTLARSGFADSLGMAADSYGWEGRSEWKQDHPEKAAPLFLNQLALGDESAIVSLKALVPDRQPVFGMLNYGPGPDEKRQWDTERLREAEEKAEAALRRAARDPVLRRLITAHILALASTPDEFIYENDRQPSRCQRWLKLIDALKLTELKDAEYLGWVAYNAGAYADAGRWLELAPKDSPAGLWLRSKLQRRDGHLAAAAKSMAQAWQTLRDPAAYTGWNGLTQNFDTVEFGPHWTFPQSASGDLGALRLERTDFVQALETLLDGALWNDAAFVAERVLTTTELQTFVAQHPAATGANSDDWRMRLRYLLGRRLVREDDYEEAGKFIPAPWDHVLQTYVAALDAAHDQSKPKRERARAFFTAAWRARHDGMELMGTEGSPDGFVNGGAFPMPDLATQSLLPIASHRRLTKSQPVPDLRYHYRVIAGALALAAAKLLPNDSEELADVLNRAGLWVKEEDETLGNRYFHILESRAAQTTIGRAARTRRWFVDQAGNWSEEEKQAEEAMHRDLKIPAEY